MKIATLTVLAGAAAAGAAIHSAKDGIRLYDGSEIGW